MDSFNLQEDIKVICLDAKSYPDGAKAAHLELQVNLKHEERRRFFGILMNENGQQIYKAAAEEMENGEAAQYGLEEFTIKKGSFNSFFIADYRKDESAITHAFELLRKEHEVDPDGYCLEWYIGENDVKCMVPLGPDYREFTGLNRE